MKQRCQLSDPEAIINKLHLLTKQLNMEIDEGLLLEKFESQSAIKDEIYAQKASKLSEIQLEVNCQE